MIGLINKLIEQLAVVISALLNLLPDTPFKWAENLEGDMWQFLQWIFPISGAIAHLQLFVIAVIIYYGLRIALRWVKAAGA